MRITLLLSLAAAAFVFAQPRAEAQATDSQTPQLTQLHALVEKVQAKIQSGKNTEADLADELKSFDSLIASEHGAKTDEAFKSLKLPPDYGQSLQGQAKEMGNMVKGFLMAFLLSLIFMYMVLASQFESFLHPITIMLSLPLSIPFALLSLFLMHQQLTIFSIMGIFMLFGIVKKNSILIVDYTNSLRAKGLPRDAAILEANKTRLRPILMTTIVLVAAMLPVAFGKGPGSSSRATMAVVIIGGQTMCLLITLLITPVAYALFDDATEWLKRRFGRARSGARPEHPTLVSE